MDDNLRAIISDEEEEQNYGVQTAQDLESELSEFRNKWKKELEKQHHLPDAKSSESKEEIITHAITESDENQAEYLFNKAVLLETSGRPYEGF